MPSLPLMPAMLIMSVMAVVSLIHRCPFDDCDARDNLDDYFCTNVV